MIVSDTISLLRIWDSYLLIFAGKSASKNFIDDDT